MPLLSILLPVTKAPGFRDPYDICQTNQAHGCLGKAKMVLIFEGPTLHMCIYVQCAYIYIYVLLKLLFCNSLMMKIM